MSHDLRTPLTRLKLRMEAVDDEPLRDRCNNDLDEMERLVTGALKLFKGVDQAEPIELVRIEELLTALARELTEMGWEVTVSGNTTAPINIRKDSLRRCFVNLISNAVKYGKRADVTVADEAGDVVVRVHDEGPGIPDVLLEKVFEPFFRVDDSRNVDTGGTGLGLSIARDVAQAHGGSLVLRNLAPRGLAAILRLPGRAAA
jgi:signal transduction histidine kinase